MPQITHRDLVAFAEDRVNLKKSEVDDQRAQVNRLRDRIQNKIATTPSYGFVKALHAASVETGTARQTHGCGPAAEGQQGPQHQRGET